MTIQHKGCLHLQFNGLTDNQSYTYRWCINDTLVHRHVDFYEISLVTKGIFKHYYNKTITSVDEGWLLLFKPNTTHRFSTPPTKATHFTICFDPSYFQLLMQLFSFNQNIFENDDLVCTKLNENAFNYMQMLANSITNNSNEASNVKLFFHNALSLLSQHQAQGYLSSDNFVSDIVEKIRNYTYLTCSIQEIYAQYPYSPATILKKFKQHTGTTINRFQTDVRLDCATRLLRETSHSIEHISLTLGFLSTSHFFEHFKKTYGMTPNAYRKQFFMNNK